MVPRLIEWSAGSPIIATIVVVMLVGLAAFLVSSLLLNTWKKFRKKNVKLATVLATDLMLMGAIVSGAVEIRLKLLRDRTRDSAAKFAAIMSSEATMIEGNAHEARLANAIYTSLHVLDKKFTGGRSETSTLIEQYRWAISPQFRYVETPDLSIAEEFASVARRARHAYSIVPQLIDSATNEDEKILLWQKVDFICSVVDSHRSAWAEFTRKYKNSTTSYSGGTTTEWLHLFADTYQNQRLAQKTSLSPGLWGILGFVAAVLGLSQSFAEFRTKGNDDEQAGDVSPVEMEHAEPGAAPNGAPATQPGNSGVTDGPPSVN